MPKHCALVSRQLCNRQPVLMHAAAGMEGNSIILLMLTSHFPVNRKWTDDSACKPAPGQESYTQNNLDPSLHCRISTPTIGMHPRPTHIPGSTKALGTLSSTTVTDLHGTSDQCQTASGAGP